MRARYTQEVTAARPTLWEFFDLSGTDNHGWNAGPLYVLSAYAAGVRPTSPGYATFQVRPQIGNQTSIAAVVPTIKGNISVTVNKLSATHLTQTLTSPPGTLATVAIPNIGIVGPTITVNGSLIYQNQIPFIGPAGTNYVGQDLDYLYFTVTSGTWSFDETGTSATFCSNENVTCSFNGVLQVRYGAGSSYFNAFGNGSYPCTNQSFNGDPLYGVVKQCSLLPPSIEGGPAGYTACANEGGTCSPGGTTSVAYGAYGRYTFKTVTGSTPCDNPTFGDPAANIPKNCFSTPLPPGNGWSQCAIENGTCAFPGMRVVAFGANGAFRYKTATARVTCDNASFGGDPIGGVPKTCYVR